MSALPHLWAKLGRDDPGEFHPVACHLLDVAQVCLSLWDDVLRPSLKSRIGGGLGLAPEAAGRWVAFWAGAHDVGKISPAFQAKSAAARATLTGLGLTFPPLLDDRPHGTVSAGVLRDLLAEGGGWPAVSRPLARRVAVAVGGHHGVFPRPSEYDLPASATGGRAWAEARREVLGLLAHVLRLNDFPVPQAPAEGDHAGFLLLAGLTSVADWVGSASDFFPFAGAGVDLAAYPAVTAQRAGRALDVLGWTGWTAGALARTFADLFPLCSPLRPLQREAERQGERLAGPGLVLIESPMGEGKTEAALYLADRWTHAHGQRGVYVALPTQATSNQMFGRVRDFLAGRYPRDRVNLNLVHGGAVLSEQYQQILALAAVYDRAGRDGGAEGAVVAEGWFTPKKRGLLAPFAVGTIDQALLSVLQTRHGFVRLFGMAGKTIVLDEVHAYDAYMSTLLERLLAWLAALGTSVVLLSATLPRAKRLRLLAAYAGEGLTADDCPYPRLLAVSGGRATVVHVPASPERHAEVALRWQGPAGLATELRRALAGGGCAAVIRNTVVAAQETYLALREELWKDGIEVGLFHARFLLGRRLEIEGDVLSRFGLPVDNSRRPRAAVLIATQVVEQSLDLDFDLLITDVAPIDLVLQRAGRLHRHRGRARPPGLGRPEVWLLRPQADAAGVPTFGRDEFVYERYVLLRSFLALSGREAVRIPGDVEGLIEQVYGDESLRVPDEAWSAPLATSRERMDEQRAKSEGIASQLVIKSPDYEGDLMRDFNRELEEDAPKLHRTLQALTRLSPPNVTLICLYRTAGGLRTRPGAECAIDVRRKPTLDDACELLRCSVNVSHPSLVRHFLARPAPPGWRETALLRHHRLAELDATGVLVADGYTLRLDPEVGAVIGKAGGGRDEP